MRRPARLASATAGRQMLRRKLEMRPVGRVDPVSQVGDLGRIEVVHLLVPFFDHARLAGEQGLC
jgi:hypothetical protein